MIDARTYTIVVAGVERPMQEQELERHLVQLYGRVETTEKALLADRVAFGAVCIQAKAQLPPRMWTPWVANNLRLDIRNVQSAMRLAELYADQHNQLDARKLFEAMHRMAPEQYPTFESFEADRVSLRQATAADPQRKRAARARQDAALADDDAKTKRASFCGAGTTAPVLTMPVGGCDEDYDCLRDAPGSIVAVPAGEVPMGSFEELLEAGEYDEDDETREEVEEVCPAEPRVVEVVVTPPPAAPLRDLCVRPSPPSAPSVVMPSASRGYVQLGLFAEVEAAHQKIRDAVQRRQLDADGLRRLNEFLDELIASSPSGTA